MTLLQRTAYRLQLSLHAKQCNDLIVRINSSNYYSHFVQHWQPFGTDSHAARKRSITTITIPLLRCNICVCFQGFSVLNLLKGSSTNSFPFEGREAFVDPYPDQFFVIERMKINKHAETKSRDSWITPNVCSCRAIFRLYILYILISTCVHN